MINGKSTPVQASDNSAVGPGGIGVGRNRSVAAGGFTLTELLVVCAILGILVSTMIPVLRDARQKSRLALCTAKIKNLGDKCLEFETAGAPERDEAYFGALPAERHVLPWRTLRAMQLHEGLPVEWADPLCMGKLTFFVKDEEGATPISTVQGLGRIKDLYLNKVEDLYCPASTVWNAESGSSAPDGSQYITYCSREGAARISEEKVTFNVYTSRERIAFLSCASFMGYQGHRNGWNVWFTDGNVKFIEDSYGVLRGLTADEWFDVPKGFPSKGRWSLWLHFDSLYRR